MAPRKKDPEAQIAELQKQRMALAVERATARSEMERAYDALGIAEPTGPNAVGRAAVRPLPEGQLSIIERRQIAGELRRLSREHEPHEQIEAEEGELCRVIKVNGPAITELEGSMARLADEIEAIEAEHRDYFIADAEQGSRGAEVQLDRLLAVLDETHAVLGDMWGRWTRVGIRISTNDLAHVRRELVEVKRECCWPMAAMSEAKWQARKAAEQAPAGARLSNRDASAQSGGEPLLEIG